MKLINNLIYKLQIKYKNNSGLDVVINKRMGEDGLEKTSVRVGDLCVTEETIKGRILSGRFDNSETFCGYRFNYDKGEDEYLVNINQDIPLETAISLINKTKMKSDFLSAKIIDATITRSDYRISTFRKGDLRVTRIITAENENIEKCTFRETILLSALEGEEFFLEKHKERIYKIGDSVFEENRSQLQELVDIVSRSPANYNDLIEYKNQLLYNLSTNEL